MRLEKRDILRQKLDKIDADESLASLAVKEASSHQMSRGGRLWVVGWSW